MKRIFGETLVLSSHQFTGKPVVKRGCSQNSGIWLDTAASRMLTYYKSDSSSGVLAPRGWHGFGGYGTSGSNLTVVPHPLNSFDDLGKDITGPGIQVHSISGEMSGRFEVARVIARFSDTKGI
jgi:hypothetical protein